VYLTGRSLREGESDRPGTIGSAAAEVTSLGGTGIPVRVDHTIDGETEALFARVADEQGRLDLLVNNATTYATDVGPPEDTRFWEQPVTHWDDMHAVGLRSHFVATIAAVRVMIPHGRGLIVNVSSLGAIMYTGHVAYNVVKAGVDMLTLATAQELKDTGVVVVSVWPRLTRTEAVLAHPDLFPNAEQAWTPIFNGRVVSRLAADPDVARFSGEALDLCNLALDYGIADVDGRRPVRREPERQTGVT
jgi:dehydrogenase/reductase SDR family protein 1